MPRPCEDIHPEPVPQTCGVCWKFLCHPGYRQRWGGDGDIRRDLPHPRRQRVQRPARVALQVRPPCAHEGDVVSWCPAGDEGRHVRQCECDASGHETCSRVGECRTCRFHAPATPAVAASTRKVADPAPAKDDRVVARFDQHNLWPGVPGLRFNSSFLPIPDGYLFAARNGWAGSEIWIGRLDRDFQPVGPPHKLELRHPMSSWGREDPVLTMHAGRPHIFYVGVTNPPIRTHVLYARLSEDGLSVDGGPWHPEYKRRTEWEKSWVPLSHDGQLYAVYSFSPRTRILRLDGDKARTAFETNVADIPYRHGEIRGGAAPTMVGDELWFFCHSHTYPVGPQFWRHYHTLLVTLDSRPPFKLRRMTPAPISSADPKTRTRPRKGPAVEFVRGAVREGDRWLLSVGVHDRESAILEFRHEDLERALVRINPPAWWAFRPGTFDEESFPWVAGWKDEYRLGKTDMRGWTVLDIGANVGAFALACRDRNASVVHCYEPDPANFALLARNAARLPGVTIFNEAVSDRAGRASMAVYPGDAPTHTGSMRAIVGEGTTTVVAAQTALSRARAESRDGWVDLLKLDCEGAEIPILEDPNLDLSYVRRLAVEVHGGPKALALYGRPVRLGDFRGWVERHGFKVTDLQNGSRGDEDGLAFAERQ